MLSSIKPPFLNILDRMGRNIVEILAQVNQLIEGEVKIKNLDGKSDKALVSEDLVKLVVGLMGYTAEMELLVNKCLCLLERC